MEHVDLATSVGYLLKRTASLLRTAMEAALRPLGLTVTQYSCLELLSQRPGLSSAALARGTFVTRQSMQLVLESLEREGLVERPSAAPTGRVLPTTLTEQGSVRLAAASAAVRQVESRMLSGLPQGGEDRIRALLTACAEGLASSPPQSGGSDVLHGG